MLLKTVFLAVAWSAVTGKHLSGKVQKRGLVHFGFGGLGDLYEFGGFGHGHGVGHAHHGHAHPGFGAVIYEGPGPRHWKGYGSHGGNYGHHGSYGHHGYGGGYGGYGNYGPPGVAPQPPPPPPPPQPQPTAPPATMAPPAAAAPALGSRVPAIIARVPTDANGVPLVEIRVALDGTVTNIG